MSSNEPSTGESDRVAPGHRDGHVHASSAIDLQERERVRIGFDLHDGPAQTMSAALLQVRMLQDLEGPALRDGLVELRGTLATALEEIYELIETLGSRVPSDTDLVSRVRSCVEGFRSKCDIEADLAVAGGLGPVSQSLQIAVFRIVQEALSNVSRHSGARRVDVKLGLTPSEVVCDIIDDGHGFTTTSAGGPRRDREPYGLRSMRERARLLDGECTIDSVPGVGTRVHVWIPVWQG